MFFFYLIFQLTKKVHGNLSPKVRLVLGKHPTERDSTDVKLLKVTRIKPSKELKSFL